LDACDWQHVLLNCASKGTQSSLTDAKQATVHIMPYTGLKAMVQRNPEHYQEKTGTMMLVERMTERQYEEWFERAAIMEHMGRLTRKDAEWLAALDVLRDVLPQRKAK
jgi:hypothetical protein